MADEEEQKRLDSKFVDNTDGMRVIKPISMTPQQTKDFKEQMAKILATLD